MMVPPKVQPVPSLGPWLQEYKALSKQIVQDESMRPQCKYDFFRLHKELGRWIAKAKLLCPDYTLSALSGARLLDNGEQFVMNELSNALISEYGLLPKSRKSRETRSDPGLAIPSNAPVWSGLLHQIQEQHPSFARSFILSILSRLAQPPELGSGQKTSMITWARWAATVLVQGQSELTNLISSLLYHNGDADINSEL